MADQPSAPSGGGGVVSFDGKAASTTTLGQRFDFGGQTVNFGTQSSGLSGAAVAAVLGGLLLVGLIIYRIVRG